MERIDEIEKRIDILEDKVQQNHNNIRFVHRKNQMIVESLDSLKKQIEIMDQTMVSDGHQSYDVDLSKGKFSIKNPRFENMALIGFLLILGIFALTLVKTL